VPRHTVQARLPDGRLFDAPPGAPVGDILTAAGHHDAVAAVLAGRLRELQTPIERDADLTPDHAR
jgi:hypothetical protein